MIPIVCVGEQLAEREAGRTLEVVRGQFEGSLAGLSPSQMEQAVIAYEPVWAIGTGKVATPAEAEQVHADLRKMVENRYNSETASKVRIQYGGSVKPDNARALYRSPILMRRWSAARALRRMNSWQLWRGPDSSLGRNTIGMMERPNRTSVRLDLFAVCGNVHLWIELTSLSHYIERSCVESDASRR